MVLRSSLIALVLAAAAPAGDDALDRVRADQARRVEVFERAARSVICIFADPSRSGGGSGVVITPDGYGLTNFHVVAEFVQSRRGYGGLSDGRLYPLRLIGIDPGGDIALVKLEGRERFEAAPLGDSDRLRVGQWVAAMGNPFIVAEDFYPTITLGVISGLHRYQPGQGNLLEYADCIQVSTSINPGNSGGPLFDGLGRVIGINGRGSFEERGRVNVGLGYAVSINQVKRFLPGLMAGRLLEHGTLGATVRQVGEALVFDVVQELSAAERAGVQLGDRLLEIDGRPMRTANDVNNAIAILPSEWPVVLRYQRGNEQFERAARLDRLPLGQPMIYAVDKPRNRREVARLLEACRRRLAATLPLEAGGRLRVILGEQVETREIRLRQVAATSLRVLEGADTLEIEPAADWTPAPALPAGAAPAETLWREWQAITGPLLAAIEIDEKWEWIGGDQVGGRIACVVERRFATGRIRWKLDWETSQLLQITVGDERDPHAATWSLTAGREGGWPRTWTRAGPDAAQFVIELAEGGG